MLKYPTAENPGFLLPDGLLLPLCWVLGHESN